MRYHCVLCIPCIFVPCSNTQFLCAQRLKKKWHCVHTSERACSFACNQHNTFGKTDINKNCSACTSKAQCAAHHVCPLPPPPPPRAQPRTHHDVTQPPTSWHSYSPTMMSFSCKCSCNSSIQVRNSKLTTIAPIVTHMESKIQRQIAKRIHTANSSRFLIRRTAGDATSKQDASAKQPGSLS